MRFSTVFASLALMAAPLISANFHYGIYECASEGGGYIHAGMIVPTNEGKGPFLSYMSMSSKE
jgi:hypothetical protein